MSAPDTIMASSVFVAAYRIIMAAKAEGWDRRREKREGRKGFKSTYHKKAA